MKQRILYLLIMILYGVSLSSQVIDVKSKGTPLDHYWSVGVGAGRVNEGLRSGWQEHLALVKEHCGFRYVRMHGLFHDDMFVCFEKPDGKTVYNWQYIDEVFDRMLDAGVKPFVELGFFPQSIAAKNSKTQFWWKGNVSVDKNNFDKWYSLIYAFTQHVVDRYGINEVLAWYFEVWNEPNLTGTGAFFHGTKSDYFRLYKEAVNAIKSIDSRLKVGGPATSNFVADERHKGEIMDHSKSIFYSQDVINSKQWEGVWIEDFLRYCEKEKLPVDFISTHPYPTDYALDPETGRSKDAIRYVHSLKDDINWLRKTLANSKFPDAEIHLTEWSTSPNSRDKMHDLLPPAAYILQSNLECVNLVNSLMYWTFTDVFEEKGGGESIFHGGFGMINFQGIVKPSFHAYRMLNKLGDELLWNATSLTVSRHSGNGKITALAYNYPDEYIETVPSAKNADNYMNASSRHINLELRNLKPNSIFELEILDEDNGNAFKFYKEINSPQSPTRLETALLKQKAWDTKKELIKTDQDGTLTFSRELTPWCCILIKEL
ncbi:GH39 family glycosyl hydrolase [Dysgonomonas macrotermitis]|uniref:Xylan 1,4-beta-xylosidase n=1 Tax=Dysgonomonas macrotermitis TaxID=1346286 RepID=A0A1M5JKB7_9BACT|nr:glycoside hydrolase [Dysgonomonas macrotermitis]SHG40845.1 xylan 1,4-beta-xylosidase [Dysgonomonas macrotermitis]